jgi:hypothetical protein
MYFATVRTLESCAKANDNLFMRYYGVVEVPQLGGRRCHKNWLQVGSVLLNDHGDLVAEYYFRDGS